MDDIQSHYTRFLAGDEESFGYIIRNFRDGLTLYINGIVKDITAAEELMEDTFVKLALKRPVFNNRSSFKTWLYAIARNLAVDYLRRRKKCEISLEECPQITNEEENLERAYIQQEDRLFLYRAMQKLQQEYRQILWLVYFEELSYEEVARIIRKTVPIVTKTAYRARQALKSKLKEEGFVYEDL